MKKLLYLYIALTIATFGCSEDDIIENQPGVSFYPAIAANATEDDGNTYSIALEVTKALSTAGTARIDIANGQFLTIDGAPAGTSLEVTFQPGEIRKSFDVAVGEDEFGLPYAATFTISQVSGGIQSIGQNMFTLFVGQVPLFNDDFESASLDNWFTYSTAGGNDWEIREFAQNNYAIISNFSNTGSPANDWLISPAIDFDQLTEETLTFQSQTAFNNGNLLKVVVISAFTGADPTGTEMKVLNPTLDPHRGGGFGNFTASGVLDLSDVSGVGHIAFHYVAEDASDGSQWQVDDVRFNANNPNGLVIDKNASLGDVFGLPYSNDLNDCGAFSIPADFTQQIAANAKQDRGWACDNTGVSGSQAVRATAVGGLDGAVDAWLVSAKPFDLSTATAATLAFDIRNTADGLGDINVLWSTDYSGDATTATWNDLNYTLPAVGSSFTSESIDISAAAGNEVYVAFQFFGATSTSSIIVDIDNISVGAGVTGPSALFENFDNCAELNSFTAFSVTGDEAWSCTTFGLDGTTAAQMSGFNSGAQENEDWLISPSVDISATSALSFKARTRFAGDPIQVKISSDYSGSGDPTAATWTDLSVTLPAADSDVWTDVPAVDLSAHTGTGRYIAFVYFSDTSTAPRWTLEDVLISE